MSKRTFSLTFFIFYLVGCGGDSSSNGGTVELPFPPETVLGESSIEAYKGNLEVTLAAGGAICGSRSERKSYDRQPMLRIALIAVDQAGALSQVQEPWQEAEETTIPSINGFTAFLVPDQAGLNDLDQAHSAALIGTGSVSLDVVPNYDTGRSLGRYDLRFGDFTYRGTFDASYCERDVTTNVKLLAWDLMTWCEVRFEVPLQPGSLWTNTPGLNTLGRDLARGLRAEGMNQEEATCLSEAVDYCKDNLTDWEAVFGDEPTLKKCRSAFARRCLQYETSDLGMCETMMLEAGLSSPPAP